jgi:phosphosulfolactate synthase (CoM biosynthesis protein A)
MEEFTMKNRDFETLFVECAERNITKEEMASLHKPDKTVFVGIDTTQHLSKDEVNLFVNELNNLGFPIEILPNDIPENLEKLNAQYNTSLVFIDETKNLTSLKIK